MEELLEVVDLSGGYGPLQVLWNIGLNVGNSETVVLLGPNGAGKTTLLKTLTGLLPLFNGQIQFQGQHIHRLRTDQKIRRGISFMTEMGVFTNLTVEENLFLGGYHQTREAVKRRITEFYGLFPDLVTHRRHLAGALSGGQRKMLGIVKALMSNPRLVIMDEPSSGLSPRFVGEVVKMLDRFRTQGISFLIAEQNIKFLEIADRVYVLDGGRTNFNGTVEELKADPAIHEAYFGLKAGH